MRMHRAVLDASFSATNAIENRETIRQHQQLDTFCVVVTKIVSELLYTISIYLLLAISYCLIEQTAQCNDHQRSWKRVVAMGITEYSNALEIS